MTINYIYKQMHMLIYLTLFLSALTSTLAHPFIVFTNDGTFYKLDPHDNHNGKQVVWHSSLPFKLLQLDISSVGDQDHSHIQKVFIPTMDGDFLYLQNSPLRAKPRQILVPREDVQSLLDICFTSPLNDEKYFVYEKKEYFVLNTNDGNLQNLQDFFNQANVLDRHQHGLLVVSRKLLKQLNSEMEVKWSVISSTISLLDADSFAGATSDVLQQKPIEDELYEFVRVGKMIEIYRIGRKYENEMVFDIQANSPIISVFGERSKEKGRLYEKIAIKNRESKVLAIEAKSTSRNARQENNSHQIAQKINQLPHQGSFEDFPHSEQFHKARHSSSFSSDSEHPSRHEMCIKTHKTIRRLEEQSNLSGGKSAFFPNEFEINQSGQDHRNEKDNNNNIFYPPSSTLRKYSQLLKEIDPNSQEYRNIMSAYYMEMTQQHSHELPTLPFSSDEHMFKVVVAKEQPYIYLFLISAILFLGFIFYRLKVNKIFEQMSQMESTSDEKLREIKEKLGEYYESMGKELKKMYEVNWEKIVHIQKNQRYMVFEGRFLNQKAQIYVLPLQGCDIIDIEHKLNLLINCSHSSISKLYYYTRNDDSLLIFAEKSRENTVKMSQLKAEDFRAIAEDKEKYHTYIKVLLDCIAYLDGCEVEVNTFGEDSLLFYFDKPDKPDGQEQPLIKFTNIRVNVIPSFISHFDEDNERRLNKLGTTKLRLDIVSIINRIGHQGALFDIEVFDKERNTKEEDDFFLKDFYDHILTNGLPTQQDSKPRKAIEEINTNIPPQGEKGEKEGKEEENNNKEKEEKEGKEEKGNGQGDMKVEDSKEKDECELAENIKKEENEQKSEKQNKVNPEKQKPRLNPKDEKQPQTKSLQKLASHPFLWDSKQKILFISEFSNFLETCIDDYKISRMESSCRKMAIISFPWTKSINDKVVKELNNYRKYDSNSVRDLIRLIRNKISHFHELSKQSKAIVGKNPSQMVDYFLTQFPKLLSFMYVYASKKKWKLNIQ